jgi:phosphate-selective porin OprO/OprP
VSFHAGGARADDTADEIRLLKARLKQLEEKVAKQDRKQKAQVPQAAAPPPVIVCKDAPCPPPPPPVFVSFANGLKVESFDHDFSFKIGGRIIADGGSTQPVQAFAGIPPFFPAHAASGFSNQVGFRQARLQVEGKAFKDWEYKYQYDFAGSPNDLIAGGIRDAYLAWRYFEPVTFQVGNFFEPNSLERTNSSLYRDFIERALASDLLAGSRHIGLAAVTGGAAPGILGNSNWSAKGGIFSTSLEDGAPVAPTVNAAGAVTNVGIPAGNSSFLNPVAGGHQYWDAVGRLTYAPILTEDSLLHLGGSCSRSSTKPARE